MDARVYGAVWRLTVTQVMLHYAPADDPGRRSAVVYQIFCRHDAERRRYEAVTEQNRRYHHLVTPALGAESLACIRGELAVERFMSDIRAGATVANNLFRVLRQWRQTDQLWNWRDGSLSGAVARCGGLQPAVTFARMDPLLYAAVQRLMVARGIHQAASSLGARSAGQPIVASRSRALSGRVTTPL